MIVLFTAVWHGCLPGSRSKRETEVAALFYSPIESAKLVGVDPKAYLLKAVHAAIADPEPVSLPRDLLG